MCVRLCCVALSCFRVQPAGKSQMDVFWTVYSEKPTLVGAGVVFVSLLEGKSWGLSFSSAAFCCVEGGELCVVEGVMLPWAPGHGGLCGHVQLPEAGWAAI